MQEYVNVDYRYKMSMVAIIEEVRCGKNHCEGRYVRHPNEIPVADTAFIVDENYQGIGIASYLFDLLIRYCPGRRYFRI